MARAALQLVEDKQGVQSRVQAKFASESSSFGIYHLVESPAMLVAALKQRQTENSWIALIGVENFGWEAAAQQGLDLRRILAVDSPVEQAGMVASLLLESVDTIAIGKLLIPFAHQRSLLARARKMGRHIFLTQPWPSISRLWVDASSGSVLSVSDRTPLGRVV